MSRPFFDPGVDYLLARNGAICSLDRLFAAIAREYPEIGDLSGEDHLGLAYELVDRGYFDAWPIGASGGHVFVEVFVDN